MKFPRIRILLQAGAGMALVAALLAVPRASLAEEKPFMTPGPLEMSGEEKALLADPAAGIEHAVILKVEFRDKEDDPSEMKLGMHLRAKILSNEARDLGDIEIPYDVSRWKLKQWWGKVIKADGTVLELPAADLENHTLRRRRGREIVIRKGALPGIEPGAVIDYGYTLQQDNVRYVSPFWKMSLQWPWPVRELRYFWTPYEYLPNGFVTTRARGLDVNVERDFKHVRVVGRNLTPVKKEPFMPPEDAVKAAVWFFYFDREGKYKDFWNEKARLVDERASEFMDDRKGDEMLLQAMGISGEAGLEDGLRQAYQWIVANIAMNGSAFDESIRTLRTDWKPKKTKHVKEILSRGEGADVHRVLMMLGAARALGAEASIVLATDRTDHLWNKSVWTVSQFDEMLVAVRGPGEPLEKAVLLAPHLGLPYGVVPYWVTGSPALVATAEGAREITPPAMDAQENVSESTATITFEMEGEPATVAWSRTGRGQHGVEQALLLRQSTGEKRAERLESLCGRSSRFELGDSRAEEAAAPAMDSTIECDGSLPEVTAEPGLDRISVPFAGPWIEPYPEFTARKRTHPLVFDYPCIDRAIIEVAAPPGYAPREAPEPVVIDNPFGSYSLKIDATDEGYRVERVLTMPHGTLRPNSLAGLRRFLQLVREADSAPLIFGAEEAS